MWQDDRLHTRVLKQISRWASPMSGTRVSFVMRLQTDYRNYGIPRQHPAVVKGKAGSPYAITDYYDIAPDLAVDVDMRMAGV